MSFDVQAICRCCLSDRTDSLQNIFDDHILAIFTHCTGINTLSPDDGLPGKICSQCVFKCISWDSFKQLCERTEAMLRTQLNIRLPVPTTSQSADAFDDILESSKEGISEVKQEEQISGRLQTKEPCDTSNGYAALELDISVDVLDEVEEYITPINSDEDEEDTKVNVKYKRTTDEVSSDELVDETESCKDPDIEWQPASMSDNEPGIESTEPADVTSSITSIPPQSSVHICPVCDKQFDNPRSLSRHQQIHIVGLPFKCGQCERSYKFKSSLSLHSRVHRADVEPFVCDLCGKSFLRVHGLKSHMLSHTTDKSFKCDLCDKLFKNEVMLRNHCKRHEQIKRFMCDECGKGFTTAAELRTHSRKHTGLKPFSCAECPNSYKTKTHLTVHMRTHTGDRPYSCNFCEKVFAHKKVCLQHQLTHTGEKPHTCVFCAKSFRQRSTMLSHVKTHRPKVKVCDK